MKKSFIIHIDSLDVLDKLSDTQAGQLFKAISAYQKGQKLELDHLLELVFLPFEKQFERDAEKYQKRCEVNRINGSKGGKQKVANATKRYQTRTNLADSDSDSDSDSVNDSDSKKKKSKPSFVKPTIKEITKYCEEKNFTTVDPENFYNFYESKNWMVGKTKMSKWKAAIANWENRNKKDEDNDSLTAIFANSI